MTIRGIFEHAEMGSYLLVFRLLSFTGPIGKLVRVAHALVERLPASRRYPDPERAIPRAEQAAERCSRLVPGAECLHRALAARVWLGRRGIDSEIVVGFRKGEGIEGHAWLEIETLEGTIDLFEQEGYRESFREGGLAVDG